MVSTHSKTSPTVLQKFTRMKSITYIYAQFTRTELYPVAWASDRGLHPVTWALRKNVECFVIWVTKYKKEIWTVFSYLGFKMSVDRLYWDLKKEIYIRQYFVLQDMQTIFWTSEGCADNVLYFRRMCRQYFGLQKDMQTVFWTSEGYADSILDFGCIMGLRHVPGWDFWLQKRVI